MAIGEHIFVQTETDMNYMSLPSFRQPLSSVLAIGMGCLI